MTPAGVEVSKEAAVLICLWLLTGWQQSAQVGLLQECIVGMLNWGAARAKEAGLLTAARPKVDAT